MAAGVAGRVASLALLALASWASSASAQEAAPQPEPIAPTLEMPRSSVLWGLGDSLPAPVEPGAAAALPDVDVAARFEDFQLDFESEFGAPRGSGGPAPAEAFALRMKERFEERFAESAMLRWYQGAERVAQRFEGLYERLEASTRWAGSGFEVHTNMESIVDGRMRVAVEREVRGFRVAFDMRDAAEGRFGLRVGGAVRGYKISVDVSDLAAGTLRLQLDKRFD